MLASGASEPPWEGPLLDFAALDVALGLVFVFVVLSLVCSALMETLSSVFAWRAEYLRKGLHNLLGPGLTEDVLAHPLVSALVRPAQDLSPQVRRVPAVRRVVAWSRRERYPSYLPSRAVVSALLDLDVGARAREAARSLDEAIEAVPSERVQDALAALLADVRAHAGKADDEVALFRKAAETWYDDTMARVSGWYKRRVQLVLWMVGLVVAVLLNVDTVNIARVLWTDDTVRASLVAQAEQASEQGAALEAARELEALDIPLGWRFGSGGTLDVPGGWEDWLSKVIGVLITSAAVSMGAPFWFDLLGKVARLRSAGAPPPPRTATEAGP